MRISSRCSTVIFASSTSAADRLGSAGCRSCNPTAALRPLLGGEAPARLVKSGPAGGVIASSFVGKMTGQDHIIIADMGGTSFETGFIPHCEPVFTAREELEFGMPIALNMIDVRAIGAGGGSLATNR